MFCKCFFRQDSVTSCKAFLYILRVSFLALLHMHLLKKKDAKDLGQSMILQYLLYNMHLSCISVVQWLWETNPWGNEMIRTLMFQDVDFMPHTKPSTWALAKWRVKNINLPCVVIRPPMLLSFSLVWTWQAVITTLIVETAYFTSCNINSS